MKRLLSIGIILALCGQVYAQSPVLQNYVEEGLASNFAIKQQTLELEKAIKSIDIAKTNFFPRVNFAPTYSVAFGGRKINLPVGDLLNPVYQTLNELTQSNSFPQIENASEQLAPMNFHDTKMEIKMPLFNTDIRYNVALQKDLLVTEQAKKRFLEYELKFSIEEAYYKYLQSLKASEVFDSSENLLQEYVKLNTKLVENHSALKDAVLTSEYELSKLQTQKYEAGKNVKLAKAYFNFLLNRPLETEIMADTALLKGIPPIGALAGYIDSALENRPELPQLYSGVKTNQTLSLMQEKNRLLPQVFVGANLGFQGFGYTFRDQAYTVAQLGLNWQLYSAGEKKMKAQQTKISGEILQSRISEAKKQMEFQVYANYQELQNSINILKNKEADVLRTQKAFEITQSRYKNGSAIFIELGSVQNDLLVSKLALTLSQMETWVKYAALRKSAALNY